jgi:hypothetical protein
VGVELSLGPPTEARLPTLKNLYVGRSFEAEFANIQAVSAFASAMSK